MTTFSILYIKKAIIENEKSEQRRKRFNDLMNEK